MAASESSRQARDLGTLRAEYLRNRARNRSFIALIFLGGLVGVVAGLIMWSGEMQGRLCVSSFGVLLLLLGVWSLYAAVRDRDLRVRVYDDGLVQRRAGTDRVIPWEAIAAVNHTVVRSRRQTTHLCTLELENGDKVQYSDATLKGVAELCHDIEAGTLAPMLETAIERLRAAHTVNFGKVTASREGLNNGTDTFSWQEIKAIEVEDRWIRVRLADEWRNLAMKGRVQNAHVLAALADRINEA